MASAFVIVPNQGQVLAVSRTPGAWNYGLPGGWAEPGEVPWQTAMRELFEETGLSPCATPRPILIQPGRVFFLLACARGHLRPSDEGDVAWLEWDELIRRAGRWRGLLSRMTPLVAPFLS